MPAADAEQDVVPGRDGRAAGPLVVGLRAQVRLTAGGHATRRGRRVPAVAVRVRARREVPGPPATRRGPVARRGSRLTASGGGPPAGRSVARRRSRLTA